MDLSGDMFARANDRCRQRAHQHWHQGQRKRQILRSQIGFATVAPSRPPPCRGCRHYHGHAYGHRADRRAQLICGFHPYGWQGQDACPDWQGADPPVDSPLEQSFADHPPRTGVKLLQSRGLQIVLHSAEQQFRP